MNIVLANFLKDIWDKINDLIGKLNFDQNMLNLYARYIEPISELFKWLLLGLTIIILILGILSFIKKTFKVFLVVAVIVALIILFS